MLSASAMFPRDRFNPLLPNAEKLVDDLKTITELDFEPKSSKELGSKLVLHQFLPAWEVQAYVRFANIALHVQNSRYPTHETTGELPQLSDGHFLLPAEDIIMHLQTFHEDIDNFLTDEQRAESYAFRVMLSERLHRVLLYSRWVDSVTFHELTRPQMKKAIPFPLNQVLPKKIRMETKASLHQYGIQTKEQAFVIARDCYTALNTKLANSSGDYFFGDKPSALDAAVFGHVVDALANPQLNKTVYELAPRLVTLAEKIRDKYFAAADSAKPDLVGPDELQYTETNNNLFSTDESCFMSKASAASHQLAFLEPYKSLNWERRGMLSEVIKKKHEQAEHSANEAMPGVYGTAGDERFDKGPRNVIIGAVIAIALYAFAALPLQIRFSDDDDEDDEDLMDEEEDDDEY
ncbi:TPA: hypothetical protein N0F65_000419 [Lagenidium giganteum]|uniref:Metaxin n=1 Tax=Lagenidium giganteum TaxID=4803 RepID=A0AAV2YGJ4_9STRA|nr:TPA: hypothetical protein N0F65_000419 [Lagenidium giganteum]